MCGILILRTISFPSGVRITKAGVIFDWNWMKFRKKDSNENTCIDWMSLFQSISVSYDFVTLASRGSSLTFLSDVRFWIFIENNIKRRNSYLLFDIFANELSRIGNRQQVSLWNVWGSSFKDGQNSVRYLKLEYIKTKFHYQFFL